MKEKGQQVEQLNLIREHSQSEDIQGVNKLNRIQLMRLSYLKLLVLAPLAFILSGLVLLILTFHFVLFQKFMFFVEVENQAEATHVFVEGKDQHISIERIENEGLTPTRHFLYLGLMYYLDSKPYAYPVNEPLRTLNQHDWEIIWFPRFFLEMMTTPLFLFQDVICIIYVAQGFIIFSIVLWAFAVASITLNYIIMYVGYLKLKQTANITYSVGIKGKESIQNTELCPEDIWVPKVGELVPCDCYVIKGLLFVDQSNLTGETTPIRKSSETSTKYNESNWVYQGSTVLDCRDGECLVVFTGFQTRKGRILRQLLKRQKNYMFESAIHLQILILAIGIVIYLLSLISLFANKTPSLLVLFRFFESLSWLVPPAMPIYFNLTLMACLVRLNWKGVFGTKPAKTIMAGKLKRICFDKTGTLTVNKVEFHSYYVNEGGKFTTFLEASPRHEDLMAAFACCNDCYFDGQPKGEDLEVEMVKVSKYQMTTSGSKNLFQSKSKRILVHKVFKFQSQVKRMSVIAEDLVSGKCFVFTKGAPQIVEKLSVQPVAGMHELIKQISMKGLRNISYNVRPFDKGQLSKYLEMERDQVEQRLQFLAIAAFANVLKPQTKSAIQGLREGGVECIIITGDNPFIGAEVANRCGIINSKTVRMLQPSATKFVDIVFEDQPYEQRFQYCCACSELVNLSEDQFKRIKIFARATPIDKAYIVSKLISIEEEKQPKGISKYFTARTSVGMVGDGANDVLAINCADVGMGFVGCESSYGAGFSLSSIANVVDVVSEGRSAITNALDVFTFYGVCQFIRMVSALIMQNYKTYFNQTHLLWSNYVSILITLIAMTFSGGLDRLEPVLPLDSFLNLREVVNYLGVTLICSLGFVGATFLTSNVYILNYPFTPAGFSSNNELSQAHLLFLMQIYAWLPFFLIVGYPYKKRCTSNVTFMAWQMVVIALNLALLFVPSDSPLYTYVFLNSPQLETNLKAQLMVLSYCTVIASGLLTAVTNWATDKEYHKQQNERSK